MKKIILRKSSAAISSGTLGRSFPSLAPAPAARKAGVGALLGGWACFAIGLFIKWAVQLAIVARMRNEALSPFAGLGLFLAAPIYYWPFFLAAFVLAIVAMAQRRVLGGVFLLGCTVIVPTFVLTLVARYLSP